MNASTVSSCVHLRQTSASDPLPGFPPIGILVDFTGFVQIWIEPEYRVQLADVKGLKQILGRSRHPHFSPGCGDFAIAGDKAAYAGAVDPSHACDIENEGALSFPQQIAHQVHKPLALWAPHHLARDRDHNHIRRDFAMSSFHRCGSDQCTSFSVTRSRCFAIEADGTVR